MTMSYFVVGLVVAAIVVEYSWSRDCTIANVPCYFRLNKGISRRRRVGELTGAIPFFRNEKAGL
jgi:hypothetical protein